MTMSRSEVGVRGADSTPPPRKEARAAGKRAVTSARASSSGSMTGIMAGMQRPRTWFGRRSNWPGSAASAPRYPVVAGCAREHADHDIGELVTNMPEAGDVTAAAAGGIGAAADGGGAADRQDRCGFAALSDAAIVIDRGRVAWTGPAAQAPAADGRVDAAGRAVLPGFVDSHAHLVFAGERGAEFAARMAGVPYSAGGIRSTVAATRAASDADLGANLRRFAAEMLRQGITTFECKSGYGLTVADEVRSVALAAQVTPEVTYLGAHVVPPEYEADPAGYVDLACGPMLDACAPHARWVDVFCERGAFDADQARAILAAGRSAGLEPRVHA